jgi:hypothetical protein
MSVGYSGTPLVRKLGIKEGMACLFLQTPEYYFELLEGLPKVQTLTLEHAEDLSVDFIHAFFRYENELLEHWDAMKAKLKMNGMLWISWPKGKSKLEKNLNENLIRHIGLTGGLVDVKVCAVDEDWSGLKFVYRTKDRK